MSIETPTTEYGKYLHSNLINILNGDYEPLYPKRHQVVEMGMRSGKTHLFKRAMKGALIRDAYYNELKNVLSPSEEFDSMAAKITQPFSIDKAIHG